MFYKLWVDAEEGRSDYIPIDIHWSQVLAEMKHGKKRQFVIRANSVCSRI